MLGVSAHLPVISLTPINMGGRIHGFLGGVLLTSVATYYTGEFVRSNKLFVSSQLQSSRDIIEHQIISHKHGHDKIMPVNKLFEETRRVSILETSKDLWNEELIKAVNWVYSIDWYKFGVQTDQAIMDLTDKVASIVEKK